MGAWTPPTLNSRISVELVHGRFPPIPHACIQMPLQVSIIGFLAESKQPWHQYTEAYEISAFERFEVVETAIIQFS
jgi:hypothetical protein